MKHTALLLIALWATSTLSAQQPQITGAFGFKFGDVFDPSKAIKEVKLLGGSTAYEVRPTEPYRACSVYVVQITPKTHLIHSIVGKGWLANFQEALKELQLVMELLRQKYGESEYNPSLTVLNLPGMFTIGSRRVYIIINDEESGASLEFIINYTDLDLSEQADKEQFEIDLPETDPSGL